MKTGTLWGAGRGAGSGCGDSPFSTDSLARAPVSTLEPMHLH